MTGDWLFWCLAGLLVIYGLALQWWAVLANRDIHGRRCPKCWYDMSGVTERRCPECGRTWRHEGQLHRRPPRVKAFGLGLIMLVAAGFAGKAARDGFMDMVPTSFLTMLAPVSLGRQGPVEQELTARLRDGRLSGPQLAAIVERWIDVDAPPWTLEIATRPSWSAVDPLHVAARFDYHPTGISWLDEWEYRVRLVPRFDGGRELVLDDGAGNEPFAPVGSVLMSGRGRRISEDLEWPDDWRRFTASLAAPLSGVTALEFDAVVEMGRRRSRSGRAGGRTPARALRPTSYTPVTTRPVTVPIRVTPSAAEAMPARTVPDDVPVSDYLGLSIQPGGHGRGGHVVLTTSRVIASGLRPMDGVVVALELDLLLDGRVVATAPLAWEESPTLERFHAPIEAAWTEATIDLHEIRPEDRARWQVRVRADPSAAMRFFDADERLHFDGTVDVPITW